MDYSLLNIFLKEKFELGSKNRNRTFRFIRYNGANYTEIKKYLNEKALEAAKQTPVLLPAWDYMW